MMKCYLMSPKGSRIEIAHEDTIGRSGTHPFPASQKMSKEHCQFYLDKGTYFISDLGSTNGTFINGDKLDKKVRYELRHGQEIRISDEKFQVVLYQEKFVTAAIPKVRAPVSTDITWRHRLPAFMVKLFFGRSKK